MLYIRKDNTLLQYDRPSHNCSEFSDGIESSWIPTTTCLPVIALETKTSDEWIIDHSLPTLVSFQPPATSATFSGYISLLPPWELDLFESLDMFFPCYELIDLISSNPPENPDIDIQLLAVSDGSAFDKSMSFGWSMSLLSGLRLATCAGPAPGSKQSSFRAKGYRLLSLSDSSTISSSSATPDPNGDSN
jgi:hypothetical protein